MKLFSLCCTDYPDIERSKPSLRVSKLHFWIRKPLLCIVHMKLADSIRYQKDLSPQLILTGRFEICEIIFRISRPRINSQRPLRIFRRCNSPHENVFSQVVIDIMKTFRRCWRREVQFRGDFNADNQSGRGIQTLTPIALWKRAFHIFPVSPALFVHITLQSETLISMSIV